MGELMVMFNLIIHVIKPSVTFLHKACNPNLLFAYCNNNARFVVV